MKKTLLSSRRRLLKSLVLGGGVLTTAPSLPRNWVTPVVQAVVLPAHAQTSAINGEFAGFTDSGVAESADATPILDLLAPRAYAGNVSSLESPLPICVDVVDNAVTNVVVGPFAAKSGQLPGDIPGTVQLEVAGIVISGSVQFDGPGTNGLAGNVLLNIKIVGLYAYSFDIPLASCASLP
ncbi:MAG: hypothetical protein WB783_08095 [Arenicellales bacterium]